MTPDGTYVVDQNRAAAIATVRAQLGLPANPTDWTYEQRVAYNKALAAYIAARPAQFNATDLQTANIVSAQNTPTSLLDTSFDWAQFGDEVVNQAASINNSVNPFSEANRGKLLWIGVAGLAIYLLAPGIIASLRKAPAK